MNQESWGIYEALRTAAFAAHLLNCRNYWEGNEVSAAADALGSSLTFQDAFLLGRVVKLAAVCAVSAAV